MHASITALVYNPEMGARLCVFLVLGSACVEGLGGGLRGTMQADAQVVAETTKMKPTVAGDQRIPAAMPHRVLITITT